MPISTRRSDEWLVRLLVSKGLLSGKDAEGLLGQDDLPYVSQEVLRRGMLSKQQLALAVENHYGIPFAEPELGAPEKMAVSLIPEAFCRRHAVFPLKLHEETIELLMANPLDSVALDSVMALSGRRPVPVFGLPEKIDELLAAEQDSEAAISDLIKRLPGDVAVECIQFGEDAPAAQEPGDCVGAAVVRLANLLIAQAVRMRASDIHIEQEEQVTVVRYRVDGDLRNILKVPKAIGEGPLVSRIKIMGNLDVADRRRPQDGRAKLRVGSEEIGLRVSTMPTSFGEKAVLRLLDRRQAENPLDGMGLHPGVLARLVRLSQCSQGMLLMTGPTGSGKTTTLYSVLNRLKSEGINIVTVEDPIEYRLGGINQTQVNERAGLTFASVLRSILRQDPDVLLVGEIRDRETADIAFQAALTGHMVFSTLHTNDSVSTISRLLDMGVDRFKMAPALTGVLSQRLARRICGACRVEIPCAPALAALLGKAGLPQRQFKGAGCESCAFTGLHGRIALTELLDLSDQAARDIIGAPKGELGLREEAVKRGWLKTLAEDALWHLTQGEITFEEAAAYLDSRGEPAGPENRVQDAPKPGASKASLRVLIVDDNMDNRGVIKGSLSTEGYDLAEADGGAAALESIARKKPDLVLLDLMMPEVDGFAVIKRLRGDLGMADMPILIVTAMGKSESQTLALDLGADDYITKPFNPSILRARVKALFRRCEYGAPGQRPTKNE